MISHQKYLKLREILEWTEIKKVSGLLEILLTLVAPNIIKSYITRTKLTTSGKELFLAFETGQFDICITMLSVGVKKVSWGDRKFHEKLLDIIKNPETCLQAMKIISRIPKNYIEN